MKKEEEEKNYKEKKKMGEEDRGGWLKDVSESENVLGGFKSTRRV